VSAIGHESDVPLLDHVADVAASTPTDAGKRVVPDLAAERAEIAALQRRAGGCVRRRLERETELMAGLPQRLRAGVRARLRHDGQGVADSRDRLRRCLRGRLEAGATEVSHLRDRLRSLSPQATLERGYAAVRRMPDGIVVRDPADARGALRVRVAGGEFDAVRQ
ncbi:MAG: exodeoxyribonuclease VII large subunit, partial [Jatrophihabitans sp.]